MAGRFGRSFYRFSSANRPLAPSGNTSGLDSAQYDGRQYPTTTRDTSLEPRARSPQVISPRRDQPLPASPKYSIKKTTSPPSSPSYRAPTARVINSPPPSSPSYRASTARAINSPPKTVDEYPKYKPTTQLRSPEAKPKSMIHKAVDKVTKSDRHHESSKSLSSHKMQEPNIINLKGENVGAVMEITESSKREGGYVLKKKETTRGILDSNDKGNDQNNEASKAPNSSMPGNTFLNNNFQSVNNSLLYNASLAHRDPGVHLAFSRNPTRDPSAVDDKKHHHTKY